MNRQKSWRKRRILRKENKANDKWGWLKNLFSILANIVSIAASIATCITVFYMREERNQAYKPYFIIKPVYYEEKIEKPYFFIHNINNLIIARGVDIAELVPLEIEIENIGSGTATDINITFSFGDEKDFMEEVCRYYNSEITELTEDNLKLEYYSSDFEKMLEIEYFSNEIECSINKSYIYTKECLTIVIPEDYRKLLYLMAYCTNGDYENIPIIDVKILYEDLQGIEYEKKMKLKPEINVDLNTDEEINYVEYSFEEYIE